MASRVIPSVSEESFLTLKSRLRFQMNRNPYFFSLDNQRALAHGTPHPRSHDRSQSRRLSHERHRHPPLVSRKEPRRRQALFTGLQRSHLPIHDQQAKSSGDLQPAAKAERRKRRGKNL